MKVEGRDHQNTAVPSLVTRPFTGKITFQSVTRQDLGTRLCRAVQRVHVNFIVTLTKSSDPSPPPSTGHLELFTCTLASQRALRTHGRRLFQQRKKIFCVESFVTPLIIPFASYFACLFVFSSEIQDALLMGFFLVRFRRKPLIWLMLPISAF